MKGLARASFFALATTALHSSARSDVIVVDESGGGDFVEIQEAVDAAGEGDLILLRPGHYGPFTIQDKGIHVAADEGAQVYVEAFVVRDLAGGKVCSVSGVIASAASTAAPSALSLYDNLGAVWLQDCVFRKGYGSAPGDAVTIVGCANVVFGSCEIFASSSSASGAGIAVFGSNVALYDSVVEGGRGPASLQGGAGLYAVTSTLYLSASRIEGGDGFGPCSDFCETPGDGGPGLALHAESEAYFVFTEFYGGLGGSSGLGLFCGYCACGEDGPPTLVTTGSILIPLPGGPRGLDLPAVVREGESVHVHFAGLPGDSAYLPRALVSDFVLRPDLLGVQHLAAPLDGLGRLLGVLPEGGQATVEFQAGSFGEQSHSSTVLLQLLTVDEGGQAALGTPRVVSFIDGDVRPSCDRRVYVDADAPPAGDGSSWSTAFSDLQEAIAFATDASEGCLEGRVELWVAEGVYRPAPPDGGRTLSFAVETPLVLLGGFAGTERLAGQRDPVAHPTVLSGDLNGDDGPGFANNDENSYRVLRLAGQGEPVIVDGFRITGGNANGTSDNGAGIFGSGPAMIRNCVVTKNQADEDGAGMDLAVADGDQIWVDNCTISGNRAGGDGGGASAYRDVRFIRCRIEDNVAAQNGGGLYFVNQFRDVAVVDSVIIFNSANDGGAIYAHIGTIFSLERRISNCTIAFNHAELVGGVRIPNHPFPVVDSILWGNTSDTLTGQDAQIVWNALYQTVDYSCIQDWDGTHGVGNISADPLLTVTGAVFAGSPCIDAGSNDLAYPDAIDIDHDGNMVEPFPYDVIGAPRFVDDPDAPNVGMGVGPIVDMGAFEVQ